MAVGNALRGVSENGTARSPFPTETIQKYTAVSTENPSTEYRCPGEDYPIPRAIHLGRMARFYPGCRQCPHRDETGTLSARQTRHLVEVRSRAQLPPLVHDEGAGGLTVGDVTPTAAHNMAAALGLCLQTEPRTDASDRGHPNPEMPVVVIAGDGRPSAAELIAAVSEAVRWTGCHVVDIGPASSACLTMAIDRLAADGGILVGNPGPGPHTAGLKFWTHRAAPLSRGGLLDRMGQLCQSRIDRPTRTYGSLSRHQAQLDYLADLATEYHALRPLQFVLDSTCGPWVDYLRTLTRPVACRIVPCRFHCEGLGRQVVEDRAHFGLRVEDDGEICHLVDQQGQTVPPERLLLLLARSILAGSEPTTCRVGRAQRVPPELERIIVGGTRRPCFARCPSATLQPSDDQPRASSEPCTADVVLEEDASPELTEDVRRLGGRVVASGALRQAMADSMRRHGAILGGGPSGRFWHAAGGVPVPDALRTLTQLLVLLSRSDRTLSEVLDHEAPAR